MYERIEEFVDYWKYERESTLKLFANLTDKSLSQKVSEDGRTLGRIAWHIIVSTAEMLNRTDLKVETIDENSPVPGTVKEIIEEYDRITLNVAELVKKMWTDLSLKEEVDMYGEMWKKGKVLSVVLMHQTHHRGQMTVLMRQAGLKVPGIYGPSKEEWASFNLPAAE
jgi:uncharacterized damage-inducible protein DinB